MGESSKSHFLVITYASWAHVRSELGLCASLLAINPDLYLTIPVPANRHHAAQIEFSQYPIERREERVRIIHYGEQKQREDEGMYNIRGGFREQNMKDLAGWAEKLVKLQPIPDSITGQDVTPHQLPYDLIICDITLGFGFGSEVRKLLQEHSQGDRKTPNLLMFGPYNCGFFINLFLPQYSQSMPRMIQCYESADTDEGRQKLFNELLAENEDILRFPRHFPMHYYELDPVEKESSLSRLGRMYQFGRFMPQLWDGIILGWPAAFLEEVAPAVAETVCQVRVSSLQFGAFYPIGPSIPPAAKEEWSFGTTQDECKAYLDAILASDGPESVLYISFGSVLFAPTTPQFSVLLDVLDELQMPFICVQGNANEGNCPPEIQEMMRTRIGQGKNRGLLVPWAPQRAVLSHPATGLFLTHGGSNSALEGILYQVPMVMWPSGFDQPSIANETAKLGIAIELLQIRNGPNIGRRVARNNVLVEGTPEAMHREMKDVFGDIRGPVIEAMRERLAQVCAEVKADKEQGQSRHNLEALAAITTRT